MTPLVDDVKDFHSIRHDSVGILAHGHHFQFTSFTLGGDYADEYCYGEVKDFHSIRHDSVGILAHGHHFQFTSFTLGGDYADEYCYGEDLASMVGSDDTTQPKTTFANKKPYGITKFKTYIPLVLDLNELMIHEVNSSPFTAIVLECSTSSKGQHLPMNEPLKSGANSIHWLSYGSLSLKAVFHENKTACAMQLNTEIRTIELGSLSITEYCNKISRIEDLLANINSPVDEKNLVTYAINGLLDKNNNNRPSATQWNNTTGRVMHGHRITISPTKRPKMSYAPEPGTIPNPTWTNPPPQYHPTVTPFGSREVLGPAPGQAHVVQPTAISSSSPSSYTNGPPPST
nr:hybrid signal transduction histidine kinase M [Tanacetum cinerariifolium]